MEKIFYQMLIILSLTLITQSFLTACPTCLHDTSFIHSEDVIGEMEVFQSETDYEKTKDNESIILNNYKKHY